MNWFKGLFHIHEFKPVCRIFDDIDHNFVWAVCHCGQKAVFYMTGDEIIGMCYGWENR